MPNFKKNCFYSATHLKKIYAYQSVYSTWSKQLYMRKIIDVRDGDITKERQNDSGMPEASMWTPLTVNTQEYRLMIYGLIRSY